ncbi:unnamed protein product [Spirodela intermedia]|uniref:protein-S-isoprenylcysteine alpha-carbonyl methylesterase n=1 Tax=Spirodela intermedia TaxID=51605 RepID=A0A7I8J5H6_SPIIN|nr:unnamed protein product [Spirodela intermedia]CAA6665486.1 unnamed protein product [Spirodela intermedia]
MGSELAATAGYAAEEEMAVSSSAEDGSVDAPFLLRSPSSVSVGGGGGASQKRRRRTASEASLHRVSLPFSNPLSSLPASPSRGASFRREVGHAAAETYLVTRLTLTLLRYLGIGYRWMTKFLALTCYAILLMPGFLQVGYYYFFSTQVRRSIIYGEQARNRLDLHLPRNTDGPKPVVAFVTGGAWIIGYKAWGSLLGKHLAERDIIVACIDYRNFPQGTIGDMVQDASQGISFVCNNIANYGGDPNRVFLIGQSAGSHIAACALLEQVNKECGEGENSDWNVSQLKAYMGISGGYNMLNLIDYFHGRGLYRSIFLGIMEGEQSLQRFSPELTVQHESVRCAVHLLPRIILFHGTGDYSIPSDASKMFADALLRVGAEVDLILYEGKTHTDLFLQGEGRTAARYTEHNPRRRPNRACQGRQRSPSRRLVPEFMLQLARRVSPF